MPTLSPSSEDVRVYEIAVMLQPDLDQKAEATLLSEIDAHFAEAKAKLLFKDPWTKRGLAYEIGGYNEAKFIIFYFEMDPAVIRELDGQLRLTKGLLRHLIVLPPKGYEAVSYEAAYQDWLKNRVTASQMKDRKKEEKLKEAVTKQAKRVTKRIEAKKTTKEEVKPLEIGELTEKLDQLISDDDLKI
jgi:small subunit ribosomal protein S6